MTSISLGDSSYWEVRYINEFKKMTKFDLFDWYVPFKQVLPILESVVDMRKSHKVLIVGVGRSDIIDCLYEKGFRELYAIDISPTLIHRMQTKYEHLAGVEFQIMDTRELSSFPDNSFSLIIDKGCIDSLFCGPDFLESSSQAFREIYRVLKQDCTFISVSYATPLARVPYFRIIKWAVDACPIPDGEGITMFILTKTNDEKLLLKKVAGGEAGIAAKPKGVVSNTNQNMNKQSTVKSKSNTGSVTVTSSIDYLAELVSESAETDG